MHAISSSAVSLLVPTPTPRSISPLDISTGTRYPSPSSGDSEDQLHEGLLVLIPVALVVFIIGALLGAYSWQRAERGSSDGSLCQAWRRRIGRRRSPRERGNPAAVCGRVTTLGKFHDGYACSTVCKIVQLNWVHGVCAGDSTAMLVEELTDIDADMWDVHLDEEELSRPDPATEQPTQSSSSSSSDTDSQMHVCTVEVHSDPFLVGENDTMPDPTQGSHVSLSSSTSTDDEDVSTQALELSPSNLTSISSYYSAHSISAPSLANSRKTLHSSDTLTASSLSSAGDIAQEIVDVVQSKEFAEDAAMAVLRCGSSQLSLFTAVHDTRGFPDNSTQVEAEGSSTGSKAAGSGGVVVATSVSQGGPERIVIPLSELQDTRFGASIMWEDLDQELQTTL